MTSSFEKEYHLEELMPLFRDAFANGQSIRYFPKGISMLPMLRQGIDSVVLSPCNGKLKKYDLPLYQRDDGHFVLHRIVKVSDTYSCVGDNQFGVEKGVRHDQVIAVTTAFYRGEKRISVTSFRYRFYCSFRHHTRLIRHCAVAVKNRWKKIFPQKKKSK